MSDGHPTAAALSGETDLLLEVLTARWLLGNTPCSIGARHARALAELRTRGLVEFEHQPDGTIAAWLVHEPLPDGTVAADLARGIHAGEIVLHYQPQVELSTGVVVGLEALARWQHPTRGLLQPGAFIPVAEASGLMQALTRRVLDEAARQAGAWSSAGLEVRVAVNLSTSDLSDPEIVNHVREAITRHQVGDGLLEVEVTETTPFTDPDVAVRVLTELDAVGVPVSVDDYGTGYATLTYLHRLPVRSMKIDRSFVSGMLHCPTSATIVRSVVDIGRRLGVAVVAEGVEDDATLQALRDVHCFAAQGYGIARPVPASDVPTVVVGIEERLGHLLSGGESA